MSAIKLAVVRYVPDPVRNEPRNVGVLAWKAGQVAARFVGEDEGGGLDLRRVPSRLIGDRQTYQDWVQFWRRHLATGAIQDPHTHRTTNASESGFLESLSSVTRGNYLLDVGAEAFAQPGRSVDDVVLDAFVRLVDVEAFEESAIPDPKEKGASHRLLAWNAVRELRRRDYVEQRDFVRHYGIFGKTVKGARVPAVFDLGVLPPGGLFQDSRKLLVDAVSFIARTGEDEDVVDRARAVASKANEISNVEGESAVVRVLVSNGQSKGTEVGNYASRILEDEAGLVTISLPELVDIIPRVRAGTF